MDPSVLDLTFLTETERKWITEVLNRDEALQKKEDERIARLKSKAARTNNATIKKKIKLRSGEWFFDLVQLNKKSFKSGRETVRASIRNKAKSTQHRRPPQPPPDVLPQADMIMEEPEQHQPVVASDETHISQSEPPPEESKISPYQLTYVEDDTANRVGSYQEDVESYDSDYNKGSTFASMHEAFVQEIPQSHVSHENETHGEVEASIENSDKQQKQAPVIPENYEYLQLTPDEPEVESEEGKPEPVLKRTGSIRRKSTKREKPQDQAPKIVLTSYDSSSTEAQSEFDEKPAESGPFALIEKDTTDESSQAASIISSTTVTGSSEKFDEYVDDILEQPAEYDTPVTTTDYSVSESDVSVEVVDVVTPSIASDDGLKTIEEEPKSEPQGYFDTDTRESKESQDNDIRPITPEISENVVESVVDVVDDEELPESPLNRNTTLRRSGTVRRKKGGSTKYKSAYDKNELSLEDQQQPHENDSLEKEAHLSGGESEKTIQQDIDVSMETGSGSASNETSSLVGEYANFDATPEPTTVAEEKQIEFALVDQNKYDESAIEQPTEPNLTKSISNEQEFMEKMEIGDSIIAVGIESKFKRKGSSRRKKIANELESSEYDEKVETDSPLSETPALDQEPPTSVPAEEYGASAEDAATPEMNISAPSEEISAETEGSDKPSKLKRANSSKRKKVIIKKKATPVADETETSAVDEVPQQEGPEPNTIADLSMATEITSDAVNHSEEKESTEPIVSVAEEPVKPQVEKNHDDVEENNFEYAQVRRSPSKIKRIGSSRRKKSKLVKKSTGFEMGTTGSDEPGDNASNTGSTNAPSHDDATEHAVEINEKRDADNVNDVNYGDAVVEDLGTKNRDQEGLASASHENKYEEEMKTEAPGSAYDDSFIEEGLNTDHNSTSYSKLDDDIGKVGDYSVGSKPYNNDFEESKGDQVSHTTWYDEETYKAEPEIEIPVMVDEKEESDSFTVERVPAESAAEGGTYDGGYQVGQDMQGVEEEVNSYAGYRTPPAILITDVEAEQPQEGEDEGKLKRVNSGRRKIVKKVVKHDASGDEADPAKSPKKKIVKVVKKKAPTASDDQENEDDDDAKAKSPKKKVVRVVKKKDVEKKSDDENVDPGNADQDQPKKKVVKVVKKKEGGDAAPKKKKVVVKKKAAE